VTASLDIIDPAIRDVNFGSMTISDAIEQIGRLQSNGRPVVPVRFHDEVAWMVVGFGDNARKQRGQVVIKYSWETKIVLT
jgi:hypothetical protein